MFVRLALIGDLADLLDTPILLKDLGAFSDDCHTGSVSKMVASRGETRYASRLNFKQPNIAKLNLNPLTCTFNTGVFVISDVDSWRKEKVSDEILDLVHSHERSQVYLNIVTLLISSFVSVDKYRSSIIGPQGGSDVVEAAILATFYRRTSPLDPLWHVRNLGNNYKRASFVFISFQIIILSGVTRGSRYSPFFLSNAKLLHWNGKENFVNSTISQRFLKKCCKFQVISSLGNRAAVTEAHLNKNYGTITLSVIH